MRFEKELLSGYVSVASSPDLGCSGLPNARYFAGVLQRLLQCRVAFRNSFRRGS